MMAVPISMECLGVLIYTIGIKSHIESSLFLSLPHYPPSLPPSLLLSLFPLSLPPSISLPFSGRETLPPSLLLTFLCLFKVYFNNESYLILVFDQISVGAGPEFLSWDIQNKGDKNSHEFWATIISLPIFFNVYLWPQNTRPLFCCI